MFSFEKTYAFLSEQQQKKQIKRKKYNIYLLIWLIILTDALNKYSNICKFSTWSSFQIWLASSKSESQ